MQAWGKLILCGLLGVMLVSLAHAADTKVGPTSRAEAIQIVAALAAEWFAQVQAPSKDLVWFEHSAHEVMDEEPGKTLLSLVRYARPFAERVGDVP